MQAQLPRNRLAELREGRKLTLEEVGKVVGKDGSTVHRWETHKTPIPDQSKLKLAEFFGVDAASLMGWSEASA